MVQTTSSPSLTQRQNRMSRYGLPSRRMLAFLNENPGATSGEIHDYLHEGRKIQQLKVSWNRGPGHVEQKVYTQWMPEKYVREFMLKSKLYWDVEILDKRTQYVSKVSRGKFAYLTSPYYSRTMADGPRGTNPHRGAVNRRAQRCWFYRRKIDGQFRYFLTLRGLGALPEHGHK